MPFSRRRFVQLLAAMAAMPGMAGQLAMTKKLKILILGGTGFLGPPTVRAALARGHEMTLFNRGRSNPELFSDLEQLRGDRDGDLAALKGRSWDAVIDTSGYIPRLVSDSARLLSNACNQYVFISSISVYTDFSLPMMDEHYAIQSMPDPSVEEVNGETYGPLKALCEQAAEAAMPGKVTTIRPGLIVGPGDKTDRFTYWPVRISGGGEVLAPGDGRTPIQVIDVRDLAEWIVHCIEQSTTGLFNAVSPPGALTMSAMLESCKTVSGSDARFAWVDASFLEEQGVRPWSDMPAWFPASGEFAGFGQIQSEKARQAGLKYRGIDQTVKDTLNWWAEQPEERRKNIRSGISAEKEADVLALWHKRS